jgi:hypothetical protein
MNGRLALSGREAAARQIERDFSGWHVWISSLGRWWAVRQGPDAFSPLVPASAG